MLLYKIEDFNPNYRQEAFDGEDIKGLDVYAGNSDDKIGTIDTVLLDETGRLRYFVVDTGSWIFGKKVLLPIALSRLDFNAGRVYATGLRSKEQVENLPRYEHGMAVDYDYEEQVRGIYRTPTVEASVPVEASLPLDAAARTYMAVETPVSTPHPVSSQPSNAAYDRDTYTYDRDPALYQMNEQDHQQLRLYEERLVADKTRRKAGEVAIGKRVETETVRLEVPVEKERVIIERITPADAGTPVNPNTAFQQQEMARLEIYEETADIQKQAFVREEVQVRKEVEQDTVVATDTVRREQLDVKTENDADATTINSL
ncbi:MAG TPA: photosystem reaction center subunit H [Cyanobacteria bacterium UBA11372]|nr:photosystem reaction center subunit H [Cyanobacteria bacterium UBA11372]HBE30001.1 photosystem reaction center subunit H [Cyanobacteria bacterium UBA11368]